MMALDVDDDFGRELTWDEMFQSVFSSGDHFKPDFKPLGNEGGSDKIAVGRGVPPLKDETTSVARIWIMTVPDEENDPDEIEAHWSTIYARTRDAWRHAYRIARVIARGNKVEGVKAGWICEPLEGLLLDIAPRHIVEAA